MEVLKHKKIIIYKTILYFYLSIYYFVVDSHNYLVPYTHKEYVNGENKWIFLLRVEKGFPNAKVVS